MLGRRVWSDDDVQKVASNFLCAADEVWCLEHLDGPGPKFFQEFGKKVPADQWIVGSTKQGIYVMTPDGDYLGSHFGRHSKEQTMLLLTSALARWEKIAKEKGFQPQPIPHHSKRTWQGEGVAARAGGSLGAGAALILQVNSRDLPRADGKFAGPPEYRTAWNQNWLDFSAQDVAALLPKNGSKTEVPAAVFRRIACAGLIDNVRGQTGYWPDASVKKARLTVEPVSTEGNLQTVRFEGEFRAEEPSRSYDGKLYGKAVYDTKKNAFTLFELAAAGIRTGGTGSANFRMVGEGDSALGVCFTLEGQYDRPKNQ